MHEKYIKRTIYIAECPKCGHKDIREDYPPREMTCPFCTVWIKHKEQSYIGPDLVK
jgi:hypothetical protein